MGRRLAGVITAFAVATALVAAPSASASHTTSVTARLDLAPAASCPASETKRVSRCSGRRVVRVTWSVACGFPDVSAEVVLWAARKGKSPRRIGSQEEGSASGVTPFSVGPGTRVFATVSAICTDGGLDSPTGVQHDATAQSGPTATQLVPLRLRRVTALVNRFCGRRVPDSWLQTRLQARQAAGLAYDLGFNDASLLGSSRRSRGGRRKITLYAKGAGISVRKRSQTGLRSGLGRRPVGSGLTLVPRKAGNLRVWAKVAGLETNVLTLKVMKRGNCFKYSIGT